MLHSPATRCRRRRRASFCSHRPTSPSTPATATAISATTALVIHLRDHGFYLVIRAFGSADAVTIIGRIDTFDKP
jgi:hypothetical protein